MSKLMSVVLAGAVALLGASALASASGTTTKQKAPKAPNVMPVLGPAVSVPVGQFVQAFATCPKGYYVTGGGAYNGAITEVASSPTKDLRGWFVDGTNNDTLGRTFQHRAVAVCVKGNPSTAALTAAAASAQLVYQAQREYSLRNQR